MAEQLESYDGWFRPSDGSKYDQWLDGGIYRLTVGEDIPSLSVRSYIKGLALARGLGFRSRVEPDAPLTLVVQAFERNAPHDV